MQCAAMSDIFRLLRRAKLFKEFSDAELEAILPPLQPVVRNYSKNAVVIPVNTTADRIGIVQSGQISAVRIACNGHSHIMNLYNTGQVFGLNAICSTPQSWPLTYMAVEDSTVLFLAILPLLADSGDMAELRRSVLLWRGIARSLADREIRDNFWKIVTRIRPLRKRIMTFFQIMQDKFHSHTFILKMSRDQFASFLGVDRSTLYRELGKLQRDGLIEIKDDRTITVNNPSNNS